MSDNTQQNKRTTAVCPGSFDPVTMGHVDIITRAARSFDHVTVLVTANPNKKGLFSVEERMELIRRSVDCDNVSVDAWSDLLVKYTDEHNIDCLVKGLRSSLDYEYELPMAQMALILISCSPMKNTVIPLRRWSKRWSALAAMFRTCCRSRFPKPSPKNLVKPVPSFSLVCGRQ